MTPVMVIMIEPELEFDEVETAEALVSIGGGLSLLAGSAEPSEKAPPKNRKIATTAAKHRNLNSPLNVHSSHPGQDALNSRDLFLGKFFIKQTPRPP